MRSNRQRNLTACITSPKSKNGRVPRPGRSTNSKHSSLTRRDTSPTRPNRISSARLLLRRRRGLLHDRALQFQRARREVVGLGLDQERIEAAIVVDALDRVGGDAQANVPPQRVRDEGHVAQVRQEAPLGLDVGVADLVAGLGALGRQFAAPRHIENPLPSPHPGRARFRAPRGFKIMSFQGAADV